MILSNYIKKIQIVTFFRNININYLFLTVIINKKNLDLNGFITMLIIYKIDIFQVKLVFNVYLFLKLILLFLFYFFSFFFLFKFSYLIFNF